ncbi:hypothetical protein AAFF_G00212830 [Aldrovandia affinis]|uniref:Uncharacterized protein n=1 Tax=Aldrovandia affinis TaxID=143900 RepID=A0AAD7RH18_9TELE|nr:hypothetical protein AAFF_G00212830 [Aldrovandia affinis]
MRPVTSASVGKLHRWVRCRLSGSFISERRGAPAAYWVSQPRAGWSLALEAVLGAGRGTGINGIRFGIQIARDPSLP